MSSRHCGTYVSRMKLRIATMDARIFSIALSARSSNCARISGVMSGYSRRNGARSVSNFPAITAANCASIPCKITLAGVMCWRNPSSNNAWSSASCLGTCSRRAACACKSAARSNGIRSHICAMDCWGPPSGPITSKCPRNFCACTSKERSRMTRSRSSASDSLNPSRGRVCNAFNKLSVSFSRRAIAPALWSLIRNASAGLALAIASIGSSRSRNV